MATLNCYASGNGALSFVWLDSGKAVGRKVTIKQAENYLRRRKDAQHFRDKNYRVISLGGLPTMVAPIKRIDEKTLQVGDKIVTYTSERLEPGYFSESRLQATIDGHKLVNVNDRSAITFFLNNEEYLTENS